MCDKIQSDPNSLLTTNLVAQHEIVDSTKIATTKTRTITESKILESYANISVVFNQDLTPELAERTVSPVYTDLTDLISQKAEDEIERSPMCRVHFIKNDISINEKVRFTRVAKNNMYKAGFSQEEVENAIKLSDGVCGIEGVDEEDIWGWFCDRYHYVENIKINHYLTNLSENSSKFIPNIFEIYSPKEKKWHKMNTVDYSNIPEVMVQHRYIKISTNVEYYDRFINFTVNKKKFIADRISQYLSSTINIFIQMLYSKKNDQEKLKNLQDIVYPDLLLSNEDSQEVTPCLSAKTFLDRFGLALTNK